MSLAHEGVHRTRWARSTEAAAAVGAAKNTSAARRTALRNRARDELIERQRTELLLAKERARRAELERLLGVDAKDDAAPAPRPPATLERTTESAFSPAHELIGAFLSPRELELARGFGVVEADEQSDSPSRFGALPAVAAFSPCQALLVSCSCPPGPCVCGSSFE